MKAETAAVVDAPPKPGTRTLPLWRERVRNQCRRFARSRSRSSTSRSSTPTRGGGKTSWRTGRDGGPIALLSSRPIQPSEWRPLSTGSARRAPKADSAHDGDPAGPPLPQRAPAESRSTDDGRGAYTLEKAGPGRYFDGCVASVLAYEAAAQIEPEPPLMIALGLSAEPQRRSSCPTTSCRRRRPTACSCSPTSTCSATTTRQPRNCSRYGK
jgi:hypothetical protein